jgi:hypothetical protein
MTISIHSHVLPSEFFINAYGKTYKLWYGWSAGDFLPAECEDGTQVFVRLEYLPDCDGDSFAFEVLTEQKMMDYGHEWDCDLKEVPPYKSEDVIDLQDSIDRLVNIPWMRFQEQQ